MADLANWRLDKTTFQESHYDATKGLDIETLIQFVKETQERNGQDMKK